MYKAEIERVRVVINRLMVCALACLAFVLTGPVQLTGAAPAPPAFLLKWGDFGSGDGQFNRPQSLAVDASGNIYVADSGNNRIQKFTNTGVLITAWGTWGSSDGRFSNPQGVAVGPSGDVYVMDSGNGRIQRFTSDGGFIDKWGAFGADNGQFSEARGLAVDASGNVYVADMGNGRIQKFTASGTFITKWGDRGFGDGQFTYPMAVAVDASGDVYVADSSNGRIQKFTGSGVFITKWGIWGSGDGEFIQPQGLTIDTSGDVYVADTGNSRIQKFDSDGGFINQWGTSGSDNGLFNQPCGVAVDAAGNVYVTDTGNNRIQVFGSPPGGNIVELTVYETIVVSDSVGVLPPVVVTVNEDISVIDAPAVLPPVVLTVNENISVVDAPMALPPVVLTVNEDISVADEPTAVPPVVLTVTETILVADAVTSGPTSPLRVFASSTNYYGAVGPPVQFVGFNANASVSMVPNTGFHIAGIVDNGMPSVIVNPYIIRNVIVDHFVEVTFAVDTFTTTFNTNGGSAIATLTHNYGFPITAPTDPTKTGYTFGGWYDDVSLTTAHNFTFAVLSDITLYAKWTANSYTITFNTNGGSAVAAITQNYGTSVSAPTDPSKPGYTFSGWYSDARLTTGYTFTTMPPSDMTLYAKWIAIAKGTNVSVFDGITGTTLLFDNVTDAGNYAVTPYNTGGRSPDGLRVLDIYYDITTDAIFIGYVTVSLHYDDLHLSGIEESNLRLFHYNGSMWEDVTTGLNTVTNVITGRVSSLSPFMIGVPVTTITFNTNGGSAVSAITQPYGTSLSAPTPPSKTGYTFSGWYSDAGLTMPYTFTAMPMSDITVYGRWTPNSYTITASTGANGSISPSGAVVVNAGANRTFTITPKAGYKVGIVSVDGISVGAVTSYTISNINANHTISATFAANKQSSYNITASAGAGGSISPSGTVAVSSGANRTFTITPKAGYRVASVVVDGASVGAVTRYTFTNVNANHSIKVVFAVTGKGGKEDDDRDSDNGRGEDDDRDSDHSDREDNDRDSGQSGEESNSNDRDRNSDSSSRDND